MVRRFITGMVMVMVWLSGASGVYAQAPVQLGGVVSVLLNIRSAPDNTSSVVTEIKAGTRIVVEGRDLSARWLRIHLTDNSARGWAWAKMVNIDGTPPITSLPILDVAPTTVAGTKDSVSGTVRASFLKLRSTPSGKGAVVGTLGLNATIIIEGRDALGAWLLVHSPDDAQRGWVNAQFIAWAGQIGGLPDKSSVVIPAPENLVSAEVLAKYVFEGNEARFANNIVLTIDDCSVEANVRWAFEILHDRGLTATFFCNTSNITQQSPKLWRDIVAAGFEIGYHTRFHMSGMNQEQLEGDFNTFTQEVRTLLGDPTYSIHYIRPPRGIWDQNWLTWGAKRSLYTVKWNNVAPDVSVQSVLATAQAGAGYIVLMHTGTPDLQWLKANIDTLMAKYRVRSVSDALRD